MLGSRSILKYALIHLAELVLVIVVLIFARYFLGIPSWVVPTAVVLWVVKDVALFPRVRRAYEYGDNRPTKGLVGLEATVIDVLDPVGYVKVRGELWRAEIRDGRQPVAVGQKTTVVDIQGMTLIVERRLPPPDGSWSVRP